jgi:hypothetical protein
VESEGLTMAACGERFTAEIVTVDGYTPANPYGSIAVPGDYVGWRQLAENIWVRLQARWQRLGEQEEGKTGGHEFWNANVEDRNALSDRVDALDGYMWTGAGITAGIDTAIKLILDMNCFREKVDDRLSELGIKVDPLPESGTPKPSNPDSLRDGVITIAVVAAVGVGAYLLLTKTGGD